jgi:hypothetical protein
MDLLLSIKDEEPSASSSGAFLPSILSLIVYRYPICRAVYKAVLGSGDVFLGTGCRACAKCQQAFRDRSKAWPVLSVVERFRIARPGVLCGWVLLGIIAGAVFYWTGWTLGEDVPPVLPVAIIFATPLIAWFVFGGSQVARSIHRFNLHGKAETA